MTNPAILTVDDDRPSPGPWPATSGAATATVTGWCGRVRRGRADALREIKLRGEEVALLLADYRMPQMNGIQFLESAMDLFPAARRVLLTAYADTDAAIDAINVVDLDHYLLKPWNPPEENLYPVLDSLLEAWQSTRTRRRRDPGDRSPVVRAVLQGPRLPGPQPGALPVVAGR